MEYLEDRVRETLTSLMGRSPSQTEVEIAMRAEVVLEDHE